jgi:tetratricopeptide (TPR) repeat protein
LLGLAFGMTTVWLEKHHVGALGSAWDLNVTERFLLAGRALWFYAAKLVWPQDLIFNYPRWKIDSSVLWQYLYPLGILLVIGGCLLFRQKIGKGPLAAILFFCATLFPALGFFNVFPFRYSYVADHFQYLAAAGLIAFFVGGVAHLITRIPTRGRLASACLGIIVLVPLFAMTWRQGHFYRDIRTLWTKTLELNPASALAHQNLGHLLALEGKIEPAMAHLTEALRLGPVSANTHNLLGVALVKQERFGEAKTHFAEAVRMRPNYPKSRYYLALLLAREGAFEAAVDHLSVAVQIDPDYADAHYELGRLLGRLGHLEKATYHFSETLRIEPGHTAARKNLELSMPMLEQKRRQGQRAPP